MVKCVISGSYLWIKAYSLFSGRLLLMSTGSILDKVCRPSVDGVALSFLYSTSVMSAKVVLYL